MIGDLADLYQEVILDHTKKPRNRGTLESPTHHAEGYNPLCGDRVELDVEVDGDRIARVRFDGSGCAISTASASLLTEALQGRTVSEARELFAAFRDLVTKEDAVPDLDRLGKLVALGGVRAFPMRVKCATLAWHTLLSALDGGGETATTEA